MKIGYISRILLLTMAIVAAAAPTAGRPRHPNKSKRSNRIFGDSFTAKYPGMVTIHRHHGDDRYHCYGIRIGHRTILTAAHCAYEAEQAMNAFPYFSPNPKPGRYIVGLGETEVDVDRSAIGSHRHFRKKDYHRIDTYKKLDVAAMNLSLDDSVPYNEHQQFVLHQDSANCPGRNEDCYLFKNGSYVNVLISPCTDYLEKKMSKSGDGCKIKEDMMCIKVDNITVGDSGSPVFCKVANSNSGYYLAGLVSTKIEGTRLVIVTRITRSIIGSIDRFEHLVHHST